MEKDITTEDGVKVGIGDRVYNYYDMKPGVIEGPIRYMPDAWFEVRDDNGKASILNGQRICSIEFAKRKGWPNAS